MVLTAWVVLAAVCGFYLLGFFRTDHDHDDVKVGPGRMVFGALFLGLAPYMAPALFGRPPQGLIWDRLIVGILPPDSSEFSARSPGRRWRQRGRRRGHRACRGQGHLERSCSCGTRGEESPRRSWGMSLDQAKELAAAQKKPILIDFTGVNCAIAGSWRSGSCPGRRSSSC